MEYVKFTLKRLLAMIPIVLAVSLIVFCLLRLSGSDSASLILGDKPANEETRAAVIKEYHLEEPVLKQYLYWLGDVLKGDFGKSYVNGQNVKELIGAKIPITLGLMVFHSIIGITLAILLGVIAALKRNTWIDSIISFFMLVIRSIPSFLICIVVLVWIVGHVKGYNLAGTYSGFGGYMQKILVPSIIMGVSMVCMLGRVTRSSMIAQLQAPYILTAKAKGISERDITYKHAFHNAVIPVLTVAGLQFAGSIGGSVLIEQIFSLPGMGALLTEGIQKFNYPVVQIVVLIMLLSYLIMSLVVDILYAVVDPRVKLG
ncbi:ABC transporter permease [Anaerosporobacter sp.]|uniref:ABC transporter permease n=1 Tax=Anaerosporobacter sp. TaxID=1872529 RepID=UPI00286EC798|nr:ABC transporter permease [Anaerosporobacter sp.]